MKVMVIASHIDDEIIGCGGTISKHIKNGDDVYVLYICTKESIRFSKEVLEMRKTHAKKVADYLKIKKIFFADLPLIMLDTVPQLDVVTAIEKVLYEVKPEVLYCHYSDDINSDHRVVFNAASVWCRPSKTPFLKKVYLYEIFGSTVNFYPNYYVEIDDFIDKKLEALSMYSTEINAQTRTLDTIKNASKYRGLEINTGYAEAFSVYREIE